MQWQWRWEEEEDEEDFDDKDDDEEGDEGDEDLSSVVIDFNVGCDAVETLRGDGHGLPRRHRRLRQARPYHERRAGPSWATREAQEGGARCGGCGYFRGGAATAAVGVGTIGVAVLR